MCVVSLYFLLLIYFFFFCKQKTAYEMRISDWSADVCSSDLLDRQPVGTLDREPSGVDAMSARLASGATNRGADFLLELRSEEIPARMQAGARADRTSVVSGKRVSVRVDLGGRRTIKTKTYNHYQTLTECTKTVPKVIT